MTTQTNLFKLSLFAILIISFFASASAQPGRPISRELVARAEQVTGDRFAVFTSTPQGVSVLARTMPSAQTLKAIDQGFIDLFLVARKHGYTNHLSFGEYVVFIAKADRTADSSGQYSPDIAVPAAQYAGGYYDQGGYIFAAGMVLANNPSAFIVAEHDHDFSRISNVVRYEGEHLVLYYNDRALYQRTADHSKGGGHPILQ
jgi:hypothetical protein